MNSDAMRMTNDPRDDEGITVVVGTKKKQQQRMLKKT